MAREHPGWPCHTLAVQAGLAQILRQAPRVGDQGPGLAQRFVDGFSMRIRRPPQGFESAAHLVEFGHETGASEMLVLDPPREMGPQRRNVSLDAALRVQGQTAGQRKKLPGADEPHSVLRTPASLRCSAR
jgi:hypothetical protein